jgi:tRNA G18 (ribose-2'-O)-methylase SpoU
VAAPVLISDPLDPRLHDYVGLTDVARRSRAEPGMGVYLAEGEKVIRRAMAAGQRPRSLLLAERWLDEMADLVQWFDAQGAPVYTGEPAVIEAITGFHVHRGALASMHRPQPEPLSALLAGARRVVVLEDIVDHTNVGAIIRSVAALAADAVLITPRCADPLYRRAVRVSMGTIFQVPWARIDPWPGGIRELQDAGFTVAALTLTPEAIPLGEFSQKVPDRLALVFGTEGTGITPAAVAACDVAVTIPMAGQVDSLNVAAAAAVVLWELRVRQDGG